MTCSACIHHYAKHIRGMVRLRCRLYGQLPEVACIDFKPRRANADVTGLAPAQGGNEMTTPIAQGPVDVNVRPLIPHGEPWVRHGEGVGEWWGLLGYTCVKKRGLWVLSYRGDTLGAYEHLSEAMLAAEGPNC